MTSQESTETGESSADDRRIKEVDRRGASECEAESNESRRMLRASGSISTPQAAYERLREMHDAMIGDASDGAMSYFRGYVAGLIAAGVLEPADMAVWSSRILVCPGHDCNVSWCAYCGDIPLCDEGVCDRCDSIRFEEQEEKRRRKR